MAAVSGFVTLAIQRRDLLNLRARPDDYREAARKSEPEPAAFRRLRRAAVSMRPKSLCKGIHAMAKTMTRSRFLHLALAAAMVAGLTLSFDSFAGSGQSGAQSPAAATMKANPGKVSPLPRPGGLKERGDSGQAQADNSTSDESWTQVTYPNGTQGCTDGNARMSCPGPCPC